MLEYVSPEGVDKARVSIQRCDAWVAKVVQDCSALHQMIWPSSTSTVYRACAGIVLQLTPSPTACTII
jgi:hypothetical protein